MRPSLNLSPWLPLCPPPSVSSKWTEHALNQGSLTPRPWISGPARNWAAQQEVSGRGTGKASSLCPAAPHPSHYRLSSASCQINGSIRLEIQCAINVMGMNYPETIPPLPSPWKDSSTKLVPGAEKAGGRCSRGQEQSGVIRNIGLGEQPV